MERTFKDRPWPFVPECLSEVISEDVLEIIQTGISLKHEIPLLIVEFWEGKAREIGPIEGVKRIEFCERFRSIQLPDGTRPADEACRICEYNALKRNIGQRNIEFAYVCHIGIIKITVPIIVANRVMALLFAGQIVYEHMKDAIVDNIRDWNKGVSLVSFKECMKEFEDFSILKRAMLIPHKEIDSLIEYVRKMNSHTPEDFKARKDLMQEYTQVVSKLANTSYNDYKRGQEETFFHKIDSIFGTSAITNIEALKNIVANILDEICKFCGASSAILFANQSHNETTLDIFETKGIKINKLRLNQKNIKGDLSKPVIIEEYGKWGLEGADKERIKGFILLPVIGNEYRISLALKHSSPETIVSESDFFDNLLRLIKGSMSNRIEDIALRKQHKELSEKDERLSKQYKELQEKDDKLSKQYEELFNQEENLLGKYKKLKEDTADIAHNFRTGLDPIRNRIGMWVDECRKKTCSSTANEHYENLSKKIVSLSKLVEETLGTLEPKDEKVVGLSKERISLESILLDCIKDYIPVAEQQHITISVDESIHHLPFVFIEIESLSLAIRNILNNAIKYSFPNTRIDIDFWSYHSRIDIIFSNFGIGVLPDEKEKVFERGYRGRAALKIPAGSGIGLTEAREIIRRHKGDVTLESYSGKRGVSSEMGEGYVTKVTVTLPIEEKTSAK